jgi:hypothetical protein
MQSLVPALEKQAKTWKFIELWVDPIPFPPKILMLVGDHDGRCNIFNPASDYKLVVSHSNYQAAQEWFLEDEYERVKGKLLAEEIM